ncbi:lysophospholipid acyltransferase 6-like [Ornithodoros turicata]|uniref:Putative conserved plasma membrane protein n=1 Tax=Ornithodoros turicata TaxID=34597 RepID=A0A2R5LLG5_9ACAR
MDLKSDSDFYIGCKVLAPVAHYLGLGIDKFNFLFCQCVLLLVSFPYRFYLHPSWASPNMRHTVALVVGFGIGFFCFGYQILHLVLQATIVYVVLLSVGPEQMHKWALALGMGYLSAIHVLRQAYDYGGYHLDVTGPLMVATQKVTSLAFNLHDGLLPTTAALHPEQRRQLVRKIPTMLEYYGYVLHYHTLMCGPLVFYNDYMDFIRGDQYWRHTITTSMRGNPKSPSREPSPNAAVTGKLLISLVCALCVIYLMPANPIEYILEEQYLEHTGRCKQLLYLVWATFLHRLRYYHAWCLGEAICNAAGFGFNGYTSDGQARWNLLSNVDIYTIETSLNLRELLVAWNKSTQTWLRTVAYERLDPRVRTQLTFVLSAAWHGFYPGYYLTFCAGSLFTLAARAVRRSVRPMVQGRIAHIIYDLLTCLSTRLAVAYIVFPFLLLDFGSSMKVYRNFWFGGHVVALLAIYILPRLLPPPQRAQDNNTVSRSPDTG